MEFRSSVYKNMCLQQLYTQAFQSCLFKGEGHNPMLQVKTQPENLRNAMLQEDHESLVEILGSLIVNQECLKIILKENEGQFQNFLSKRKEFNTCNIQILQNSLTADSEQKLGNKKLVDLAQNNLNAIYNSFEFDPKQETDTLTSNKQSDAKTCVSKSSPILFSLIGLLTWQMKMFLIFGVTAQGVANGIKTFQKKMTLGQQIWKGINSAGSMIGLGGLAVPAVTAIGPLGGLMIASAGIAGVQLGLFASACSLAFTGGEFNRFFKDSEQMQRSYKYYLKDLLTKFGYKLEDQLSIAALEEELAELCQWLLQQPLTNEIDQNQRENQLNQKILKCILNKTNASEERQERDTKEERELKRLINQKINFLSKEDIFQNHENDVRLAPSRGLSALLVFIWNNHRIRSCLSKTITIGIMGGKNAGKSTLAMKLGCAIERIDENCPATNPMLYYNVPIDHYRVFKFPPLDQLNENAKMLFSLSDIAIIVMGSRCRARRHEINLEVSEIVKAIQMKYDQLGYKYTCRRLPVLLLFNQVDKMMFDRTGDDPDDQTLSYYFLEFKRDIISALEEYGIDKNKVFILFASLQPKFPKQSYESIYQQILELQNQMINQNISMEEYQKNRDLMIHANSADRDRLQNVTNCSFFSQYQDHQENPKSIVSILAKIVQELGDKQGADSIRDVFKNNHQ